MSGPFCRCPGGTTPMPIPSTGPIGTAYGKWLGLMYMHEKRPKTYGLVDFDVWTGRYSWQPGKISKLFEWDPTVALALMTSEWTRRSLQRTDILDSDEDHVYEIKPVREASAGPPQLNGYLASLRANAPMTSPIFGLPRVRNWEPGPWDPSPYCVHLPGIPGPMGIQSAFIHAWRDTATPGLLLYDIVCCVREQEQEEAQPALVATKISSVTRQLKEMRPKFEELLRLYLPKAPAGTAYAFIATPPFFEAFVLAPWNRELDRQLQKMYGLKPGPALMEFLLASYLAAHLFPVAGPIADIAMVESGFMKAEELPKLYAAKAIAITAGVAGVACVGAIVELPALLAAQAAGATLAPELTAAATTAGTALATTEVAAGAAIPGGVATIATGALDGVPMLGPAAGEAILAGTQLSPFLVNAAAPAAASAASAPFIGLGTVALAVVGLVSGDAQAGTSPLPKEDFYLGIEPIQLVPIQLLVPVRGEIKLNAQCRFGEDMYYIIGLVTA